MAHQQNLTQDEAERRLGTTKSMSKSLLLPSLIIILLHKNFVESGSSKLKYYIETPKSLYPQSKSVPVPTLDPDNPPKWFDTMETKEIGKMTARELQHAFETIQGKYFSENCCKFVVRLFDLDKKGGLDVKEFEELYTYVKRWVEAFNMYDADRSGYLNENELDCALKHMDIYFSSDFIKFLIKKANADSTMKKMSLDQFIVTCIQIQRYTEEFRVRDENYRGEINMKYEDFLEMVLRCL